MYDMIFVIADKNKKPKLRKCFTEKIKDLEQNLLNCCNPDKFGNYISKFRLIEY